jgi:hypothetical protein
MGDKLNVFESLVFYYLQIKKFIPTISEFFTKDWILPVESYHYGVLLANTDYITWQSECCNSLNLYIRELHRAGQVCRATCLEAN